MIDSCEHRQLQQKQQQQQHQRKPWQWQRHHHHNPIHRLPCHSITNASQVHANCCCHAKNGHRSSILIDASQSHRITTHRTSIHIWTIVLLVFKQILRTIQTIGKHANNHVRSTNQCRWMLKDNVNIGNDTKLLLLLPLLPLPCTTINFLRSIFTNVGQITYNFEQIDAIVRLRIVNVLPAIVAGSIGGGISRVVTGGGGVGCSTSSSGVGIFKPSKHTLLLLTTILMCLPIWSCQANNAVHNLKYSSNTVKTKYGELRGLIVRNNPTVEAYLGVPYATPPIGSLRLVYLYIFCCNKYQKKPPRKISTQFKENKKHDFPQ